MDVAKGSGVGHRMEIFITPRSEGTCGKSISENIKLTRDWVMVCDVIVGRFSCQWEDPISVVEVVVANRETLEEAAEDQVVDERDRFVGASALVGQCGQTFLFCLVALLGVELNFEFKNC